jgi:hypothetical protein
MSNAVAIYCFNGHLVGAWNPPMRISPGRLQEIPPRYPSEVNIQLKTLSKLSSWEGFAGVRPWSKTYRFLTSDTAPDPDAWNQSFMERWIAALLDHPDDPPLVSDRSGGVCANRCRTACQPAPGI